MSVQIWGLCHTRGIIRRLIWNCTVDNWQHPCFPSSLSSRERREISGLRQSHGQHLLVRYTWRSQVHGHAGADKRRRHHLLYHIGYRLRHRRSAMWRNVHSARRGWGTNVQQLPERRGDHQDRSVHVTHLCTLLFQKWWKELGTQKKIHSYSSSVQEQIPILTLPPSAPCVPQNLKANLSCSNNVASMSWNYSRGAGQLYRVRAVGADGHVDECSSNENQCDLTGLRCGQHYTATVLAEHRDCKSKPSDSVTIKTGMCTLSLLNSQIIYIVCY